jgi:hypothetical protein
MKKLRFHLCFPGVDVVTEDFTPEELGLKLNDGQLRRLSERSQKLIDKAYKEWLGDKIDQSWEVINDKEPKS